MFFKRAGSVEKQLLNFRNASVSHCFRNLSLTIIWNHLGLSNYKRMKRNLGIMFREESFAEFCHQKMFRKILKYKEKW